MDESQLELVLTVGQLKSISKAASQLHLSTQGAKERLDQVERDFGCTLFYRTNRGCLPTPNGEVFCSGAPSLLEHIARFQENVRNAEGNQSVLKVALWSQRGNPFEDEIVYDFTRSHPDVEIEYVPISEEGVLKDLENGALDVSFFSDDIPLPANSKVAFSSFAGFKMGYQCLVSEDNPLAKVPGGVSPNQLSDYRIAFATPKSISQIGGIRADKYLGYEKYEIVNWCRNGGVCLCDEFLVVDYPALKPIVLNVEPATMGVLHRKEETGAVAAFLESVQNVVDSRS